MNDDFNYSKRPVRRATSISTPRRPIEPTIRFKNPETRPQSDIKAPVSRASSPSPATVSNSTHINAKTVSAPTTNTQRQPNKLTSPKNSSSNISKIVKKIPLNKLIYSGSTNKFSYYKLTAIVVIIVASSILLISSNGSPFTNKFVSSVNLELYYPTNMPHGYSVDKSSIHKISNQAIQFNIVKGKTTLVVNEANAASESNILGSVDSKLSGIKNIKTPYGDATIGAISNSKTGVAGSLITADGSWIIASSGNSNNYSDLYTLFTNLRRQ